MFVNFFSSFICLQDSYQIVFKKKKEFVFANSPHEHININL